MSGIEKLETRPRLAIPWVNASTISELSASCKSIFISGWSTRYCGNNVGRYSLWADELHQSVNASVVGCLNRCISCSSWSFWAKSWRACSTNACPAVVSSTPVVWRINNGVSKYCSSFLYVHSLPEVKSQSGQRLWWGYQSRQYEEPAVNQKIKTHDRNVLKCKNSSY